MKAKTVQTKIAANGEMLTNEKCALYELCSEREPYFGFIPLTRKITAESRGKSADYCSDRCRHTYNIRSWREGQTEHAAAKRERRPCQHCARKKSGQHKNGTTASRR